MSTNSTQRALTVYIGRFSPFHNGHAEVLLRALRLSKKVLVIIGSAKQPRRVKNPWTAQERGEIIYSWYASQHAVDPTLGELVIESNRDFIYNDDKWLISTYEIIARHQVTAEAPYITGADRDRTTFYLKKFPRPKFQLDLTSENERVSIFLTATSIRDIYFGRHYNGGDLNEGQVDLLLKAFLPVTTLRYMIEWMKTDAYSNLVNEYMTIRARKAGKKSPDGYPVLVQTVDAAVIQSGYILLVRRAGYPGKGLWALPGGHLGEYEWMLDGAIRELKEESKLKVPEPVLYGSLKFDLRLEHPDRSELGRVISQLFCFKLPDHLINGQVQLPEVYGTVHNLGDGELNDTDRAKWFSIAEALEMSDQMFDDHHAAIELCVDRLTNDKSDSRKD